MEETKENNIDLLQVTDKFYIVHLIISPPQTCNSDTNVVSWLHYVHRQISHAHSGREHVQQYITIKHK